MDWHESCVLLLFIDWSRLLLFCHLLVHFYTPSANAQKSKIGFVIDFLPIVLTCHPTWTRTKKDSSDFSLERQQQQQQQQKFRPISLWNSNKKFRPISLWNINNQKKKFRPISLGWRQQKKVSSDFFSGTMTKKKVPPRFFGMATTKKFRLIFLWDGDQKKSSATFLWNGNNKKVSSDFSLGW